MAELGKYFETASLGRNRYQTTIGIKPVNYQDGSTWKRISNNWADSGDGDRPHIVTAAPFITSVSPDGLRRIHPTREDDVWFEMSGAKINQAGAWNVVQLGVPTSRVNNRITWNRTNFNAYMDMAGHYVKLGYLLKNGYLPPNNQFAYEVATNGLTREGGTLLKDGVPVMRMRKPIAYDYDNPEDVRQIAHEITRIDGKWHVVFTLPSLAGMSKPLIDPTLELQPDASAGKDTRLREDLVNSTYNYGIADSLGIDTPTTKKGLIQFDVSSISANAIIESATLTFKGTVHSTQEYGIYRGLVEWFEGIKDGAAPGAEDGSTWDHRNANTGGQVAWTGGGGGASGTEWHATATKLFTPSTSPFGITGLASDVQNWVDGTHTNYGWWIYNTGTLDQFVLYTSDYATPSDRPKLTITWRMPLVLQPDAAAGKDAMLRDDNSNVNYGVSNYTGTGESNAAASVRRTLIQFDLTDLPSDATITSSVLSLYHQNNDYSDNTRTLRVYRMKQAWLEGTQDGADNNDGATWNEYDGSNNWTSAGGFAAADCEQTDIGNLSISDSAGDGWFDISLTPTTKAELDYGIEQGGSERGWMVKMDTETDDLHWWHTSDYATPADRPKLVIDYTVPSGYSGNPRILQRIRLGY